MFQAYRKLRVGVAVNPQFLALPWDGTMGGAAGELDMRYRGSTGHSQGKLLCHNLDLGILQTDITIVDHYASAHLGLVAMKQKKTLCLTVVRR